MGLLDCYNFEILDVLKTDRKSDEAYCAPRFWSVLSFRISGYSNFSYNGEKILADKNSVLFIPAGIEFHRISKNEELIAIHMKTDTIYGPPMEIFYNNKTLLIQDYFMQMYNIWDEKLPGYKHKVTSIFHMLLFELCRNNNNFAYSYNQLMIKPATDYINTNFNDPNLSINELAKMCNISTEYFRKLYKEIYGISPHNDILDKKIKKACNLLQSGYYSISEVAEKTGFQNYKYFSTFFRKRMKVSPIEYKNMFNSSK